MKPASASTAASAREEACDIAAGRRGRDSVLLAAVATAAASIMLLVTALTRPRVCPAVFPAPAWCFDDVVNGWLIASIVVVVIVAGATVAASRWAPSARQWATPLGLVLVVGVTISLVATRVWQYGW